MAKELNSAAVVLRVSLEFWQFRTILVIEVCRDNPVTYGRKSTYNPHNVNKGENRTFFSLNQGNPLSRCMKSIDTGSYMVSIHDRCIGRPMGTDQPKLFL